MIRTLLSERHNDAIDVITQKSLLKYKLQEIWANAHETRESL